MAQVPPPAAMAPEADGQRDTGRGRPRCLRGLRGRLGSPLGGGGQRRRRGGAQSLPRGRRGRCGPHAGERAAGRPHPAPVGRGPKQLFHSVAAGSPRRPRPHLAGGPAGRTTARPPARTPPPGFPPASRPAPPGAAAPAVPPQPLPRALRRPRRPQPEPPAGGTRRRAAAPLPDSPRAAQPPQRPAPRHEREPRPAPAAGSSRRSTAQRGTLAAPSRAGAAFKAGRRLGQSRRAAGRAAATPSNRVSPQARGWPGLEGGRPMRMPGETKKAGKRRRGAAGAPPSLGAGSPLGVRWVPAGGGGGPCEACLAGRAASRGSGGVGARARGQSPASEPGPPPWRVRRAGGGARPRRPLCSPLAGGQPFRVRGR